MRCAYSSISCPAGEDVPWSCGGDIAVAVETPAAVRVLIGDVMGHGPKAEETAGEVRDAFGRLAADEDDPPEMIATRLDRLVANLERREEFVTAQLIDIPRGRASHGEPQIVCCGHPPPLLLSGGQSVFLDMIPPAPPLGLLDLAGGALPHPSPLGARAGDTILLYTDGVTEARGQGGLPYPFDLRASAIAGDLAAPAAAPSGATLVEALKTDLLAHAGGTLRDDATLMCLQLAEELAGELAGELRGSRVREDRGAGYSNVQYS